MIYLRIVIFVLSLLFIGDLSLSAQAQSLSHYQKAETYKERQIIQFVSQNHGKDDYFLWKIDLNDDFIDEYFVKPENCQMSLLCPIIIVAFMDNTPIELAQFDAHKIVPSTKKNYGIQQLIIYNQINNDYAHQTAIWDPYQFKYSLQ